MRTRRREGERRETEKTKALTQRAQRARKNAEKREREGT